MAISYPGPYNVFVPSFDASGHLVVAFSRNPRDFPLNRYLSIVPVSKSSGYYLRITPEVAARVLNTDLKEFVWPAGSAAPTGEWSREAFEFFQFETKRYAYPFTLDQKTEEQADWRILASHAAIVAQQAMTARTLLALTALTTTSNYPANHVDTATNWGGGFLNAGTADGSAPGFVLKKALNAMARRIQLDTLGAVKPYKDCVVLIDPILADALGRSKEVHAYLKESPYALAQVRGDVESQNGIYGLPNQLYGFSIVVDDAVRVTTRKGVTTTTDFMLGGNTLVMLARPGALTCPEGARSFSTLQAFVYEDMTVESRTDPDNRRIVGRVVDDFDVRVTAPATGCICTNALS